MYMRNERNLRLGPNATYIPRTCITYVGRNANFRFGVGGNTNFRFGVGGNANFHVFRYQHVVIPNAKLWLWGSEPTPAAGPNANGFASQWNIGFKEMLI